MKRLLVVAAAALVSITPAELFSQTDGVAGTHLSIFGGLGFPIGELASTSSDYAGFAKTGFGGGLELTYQPAMNLEVGMLGDYFSNSVDEAAAQQLFRSLVPGATVSAGSWTTIHLLASIGFVVSASDAVEIFGRGYAGLLFGTSPELTASAIGVTATQSSASSTTAGYGLGGGARLGRMEFGFRYLTGEPEYDIEVSASGGFSFSGKAKQPTSLVLLYLGYTIL